MRNGPWTLETLLNDRKPTSCKWGFRIKENPDGSIQKYKTRLVAKGFHKKEGVDNAKIFSPVVKPATVRLVLSIALTKGGSIRQFNFNNAFFNRDLSEEVYMS